MKIVGLKIEKGLVAVSVVQKDFRRKDLVDSFILSFSTDAELVEILKEKSGDWKGAKIVSSIPGHFFTQRLVQFPFADRKRVEKALPFEVEDIVPFDLDNVIMDHIVLDAANGKGGDRSKESQILCMMLPKDILKNHLELLASAGLDPQVIVPSYIGLDPVSKMIKAEGTSLLACGRDICLRSGERVKALRSISNNGSTGALRHIVQALEIEQKERVEKVSLLCPDDNAQALFSDLGMAVEQVASEFSGKQAADPVSLGLALSADEINFRKQEFSYRLMDEDTRRKKRTLVIAAAIAAFLFVVNLSVKIYTVETTYRKLDTEIRAIYRQAVPDAKVVADPVRQLRSSLDEANRKFGVLGTGTSALDAMRAVTESVPKEIRVAFNEFNLEGDRLKLQGEAASFEAIDKIKAELQKLELFSEVTVLDTRMGTDNKVKFRLDMKLKQAG